ncbi:hypothetical protein, partial [Ruegeria marina]|uniref:hypothetical protein n=1 Tax=Ruegeria marina TaxID=639004 RepID=UPI001C408E15
APIGRTNDRNLPRSPRLTKSLAKPEPSTNDTALYNFDCFPPAHPAATVADFCSAPLAVFYAAVDTGFLIRLKFGRF